MATSTIFKNTKISFLTPGLGASIKEMKEETDSQTPPLSFPNLPHYKIHNKMILPFKERMVNQILIENKITFLENFEDSHLATSFSQGFWPTKFLISKKLFVKTPFPQIEFGILTTGDFGTIEACLATIYQGVLLYGV